MRSYRCFFICDKYTVNVPASYTHGCCINILMKTNFVVNGFKNVNKSKKKIKYFIICMFLFSSATMASFKELIVLDTQNNIYPSSSFWNKSSYLLSSVSSWSTEQLYDGYTGITIRFDLGGQTGTNVALPTHAIC